MKRLVLNALFAATALLAPGAVPNANAAGAHNVCDGDVPETWRRPGGYCDQVNGGSLIEPGEPACPSFGMLSLPQTPGARVHVAVIADPCQVGCTSFVLDPRQQPVGDRVVLAVC